MALPVPDDVSRALAAELKARREAAGMSQADLAEKARFRGTRIYQRPEYHERRCSIPQLVGLANALGVYPEDLLHAARIRAARGDFPDPPGIGGAFGIG